MEPLGSGAFPGGGGWRLPFPDNQLDLQEATKLARRRVTSWGMVDSIGPIYYGGEDASEVFLGRDFVQKRDVAGQTAAKLDEAVCKLIGEAHE